MLSDCYHVNVLSQVSILTRPIEAITRYYLPTKHYDTARRNLLLCFVLWVGHHASQASKFEIAATTTRLVRSINI